MPRPAFDAVHSAPATSIVTTAETLAQASNPLNTGGPGSRVFIRAYVNVTAGLGTTSLSVRVRRGNGVTGTLVNQVDQQQGAAAGVSQLTMLCLDSPGEVAGQQYSVTVVQNAATGNGTINDAGIETTAE